MNYAARFDRIGENAEAAVFDRVGNRPDLQTETQIGLVGSVFFHRLPIRDARELFIQNIFMGKFFG